MKDLFRGFPWATIGIITGVTFGIALIIDQMKRDAKRGRK